MRAMRRTLGKCARLRRIGLRKGGLQKIGLRRIGMVAATVVAAGWPGGAGGQAAVGLIAGASLSSFTGSGAVDVKSGAGPLFGLSGAVSLGETLALRPELYLVRKGAHVNTRLGDFGAGPSKEFALHYLQIPLLLELRTGSVAAFRPRLFGGVSAGLLVNCELEDESCERIDEIRFRRADLGVVVGGELEWRNWGLGARYEAAVRAFEISTPGAELYNGALTLTLRFQPRRTRQ